MNKNINQSYNHHAVNNASNIHEMNEERLWFFFAEKLTDFAEFMLRHSTEIIINFSFFQKSINGDAFHGQYPS